MRQGKHAERGYNMDEIISTVNAEPVSTVETQSTEQVSTNVDSVNADIGEVKSTQQEVKQVQTPEENAHFAEQRRAREAAETKAANLERDYSISRTYGADWGVHSEAEISERYGHLGITNLTQFKEAIRIKEMQDKGIDPDEVNKYVSQDPRVKAAEEWQNQQIEANKKNADIQEFFKLYKKENGKAFDAETDTLPMEVIEMAKKGKPLADAYTYHINEQLKAKIAELEGKKKAEETNKLNANSSTGSITGNGSADTGFISFEAFEAKKSDTRWVVNNLSKIQESRAKW